MKRDELNRPYQKPFYVPGDEIFRYNVMGDELGKIEKRLKGMRKAAATEDDDLALAAIHERIKADLADIEALKVKMVQREEIKKRQA